MVITRKEKVEFTARMIDKAVREFGPAVGEGALVAYVRAYIASREPDEVFELADSLRDVIAPVLQEQAPSVKGRKSL